MSNLGPLWNPTPDQVRDSNLTAFIAQIRGQAPGQAMPVADQAIPIHGGDDGDRHGSPRGSDRDRGLDGGVVAVADELEVVVDDDDGDNGARNVGGSRFLVIPPGSSWEQAAATAKAAGGHLAVPSSAAEEAWIATTMRRMLGSGESCWIGGRLTAGPDTGPVV